MLDKPLQNSPREQAWRLLAGLRSFEIRTSNVVPVLFSLAIVALVTLFLAAVGPLVELDHAAFGYLIPVIIAAARWGAIPAAVSAAAGMAASAFFFYPPLYDIRVYHPAHVADLLLFGIVALISGHLANSVRLHEQEARQRGEEIEALYFFSRRLAVASGPSEIYTAIQDHLSAITGCRILLFEAATERARLEELPQWEQAPLAVRSAIIRIIERRAGTSTSPIFHEPTRANWLVRTLSQRTSLFGVLAIEIGRASERELEVTSQRIDSALQEAAATLERIDIANAVGEARVRAEGDTLREALIGSVSHELRTPLSSIIGSASILVEAPGIVQDPRLAALAGLVREEAERLNGDIQNLLDASRISSAGVRPHLESTDPADIVNAAVERRRPRLVEHQIDVELSDDLPLVHVDSMLIEQALSQIIDNAVKYSKAGSTVTIATRGQGECVAIVVSDEGSGLSPDERGRVWERFYRGPRHAAAVPGSGLGLWIARAFVVACGGSLDVASRGIGLGTIATISLPVEQQPVAERNGAIDD